MEISSRFFENHIMPKMLTILKILSIMKIKENLIRNEKISKYERGIIMKNIIKKSITTIVVLAMALTLVIPMTAQAKTMPKLNKTKVTISVKKSYQLKVKGTSKKVTWKSNNKKVAIVSKNGKVTGKKKGSAVITAKVNKKAYKCKVTVTELKPALNKTKVTLTITFKKTNPAYQLKVTNVAGKKVNWTTSNKKIVTVSKAGKITAKKKGTAIVKAKVGNKTLSCTVVVKDDRDKHLNHEWAMHYISNEYYVCCWSGEFVEVGDKFHMHGFLNAWAGDSNHCGFSGDPTRKYDYRYCKICGIKENCTLETVDDICERDGHIWVEISPDEYCQRCGGKRNGQ